MDMACHNPTHARLTTDKCGDVGRSVEQQRLEVKISRGQKLRIVDGQEDLAGPAGGAGRNFEWPH